MGKLITIVGNNASGKTTLAKELGKEAGFSAFIETHEDRPYQALFAQDVHRYALHNQLDFLLRRAEQERQIREGGTTGVQDGGLDQDFHLYTRLFHHKGYLDDQEFDLCCRMYTALRAGLPAPDLVVWLRAPLDMLSERIRARARMIDLEQIATLDDLPILEGYLEEWLSTMDPSMVLSMDVQGLDLADSAVIQQIRSRIGLGE